jgi:hypothetical protein
LAIWVIVVNVTPLEKTPVLCPAKIRVLIRTEVEKWGKRSSVIDEAFSSVLGEIGRCTFSQPYAWANIVSFRSFHT